MRDQRKRIVAAGYDRMSAAYLAWAARIEGDPRDRMLEAFAGRLPAEGRVLDRIFDWLRPGGLLLAALGCSDDPGWSGEWLGVPMFFSGFDADTSRSLLGVAGFEITVDEIVEMREPKGVATFHWVIATKPAVA